MCHIRSTADLHFVEVGARVVGHLLELLHALRLVRGEAQLPLVAPQHRGPAILYLVTIFYYNILQYFITIFYLVTIITIFYLVTLYFRSNNILFYG